MRPADITVDDGRPDIAGAVALHPAMLCEDKALHPLTEVLYPAVSNEHFTTPGSTRQLQLRSSSFAAGQANSVGIAGHCKMQAYVHIDPCLCKVEVHAVILRIYCRSRKKSELK